MKIFNYIFFLCIVNFSSVLIAQSVVVVDIQNIIDNNQKFIDTVTKLEISQQKFLNLFEQREMELKKNFDEIENSKLILNQNEINIQIDNYNDEFNKFSILVNEFNLHYKEQINKMREVLLNEIIQLLENYAINNEIELILDSNNYLIASSSIDITELIKKQLNEINILLEYNDFEEN